MLKGLEYETVILRAVFAMAAAVVVILGLIALMGIQLMTCNPLILLFAVAAVTALFWICSMI